MRACLRRSSPSRFRTCSPRAAGHRANKLCLRDHRLGGDCAYDISKAGLNMLSDHIAVEYGPQGIRSNTLMPGVIETELHRSVVDAMEGGAEMEAGLLNKHPIGRFGRVEEV